MSKVPRNFTREISDRQISQDEKQRYISLLEQEFVYDRTLTIDQKIEQICRMRRWIDWFAEQNKENITK